MSTTSVIVAAMNKFDGLTAGNFPSSTVPAIYLDEAPQVTAAGAQLRPPYAVIRDNGQTPNIIGFERTGLEVCEFTIELYYASMADVATAIWAVRLNGGTIGAGSGFDYGTFADLASPRGPYQILRGRVQHTLAGYGHDGKPVYKGSIEYKVTIQESA